MLPHDLLAKSPVDDDVARWRADGPWGTWREALRAPTRRHAGREPTPSTACLASPSVKTTEMGGRERSDDGGQKVKGRKRHLVGETLGVSIGVWLTRAGLAEGVATAKRGLLTRHP
jgi:hypothetical protein